MPRGRTIAVAVGGALGATCRWAAIDRWPPAAGSFPWTVFLVNVAGSAVVGLALAEEWRHPGAATLLRDGVGIGFCGGLTTMSTFAVEAATLARGGHGGLAIGYVVASFAAALLAVVAGALVGRRVGALVLPLEGPDR